MLCGLRCTHGSKTCFGRAVSYNYGWTSRLVVGWVASVSQPTDLYLPKANTGTSHKWATRIKIRRTPQMTARKHLADK